MTDLSKKKGKKWKYTNMDPQIPPIGGLIRVHKQNASVRTAVNWTTAPDYTLLQHITNLLGNQTENQSKK